MACLSVGGFSLLLNSCKSTQLINGTINGSDMLVPLHEFEYEQNGEKKFKKYIVLHNDQLQFPICIYRFSETSYSALLMRCSHQGAELQVFGDKLQCPAHGSEFDNKGIVQNSPADTNLRSFPIRIEQNELKISLQ